MTGRDGRAIVNLIRQGLEARGLEYAAGIVLNPRFQVHMTLIPYDLANEDKVRTVYDVCKELVVEAAQLGYGEYRADLDYMDAVAAQCDWNDRSRLRLAEAIKDALDPDGILAPGNQGIWPRHLRTDGR